MRKSWPLVCFALALLLTSQAHSQGTPANPTPMPTDPKALMLVASQLNSLTNSDVKAWHLKATYKLLDGQGVTTDEGTYEELWAGPTQFKRTYTGNGFSQTDYGTAKGVMRSGTRDDVRPELLTARREFVTPMQSRDVVEHQSFSLKQVDSNGAMLACVSTVPAWGFTYCFDPTRPILRLTLLSNPPGTDKTLHNRILGFQNHYIAGDLTLVSAGKSTLKAHLESIEAADPVIEADFAPPPDAVLLPRRVSISAGVAVGMLVKRDPPDFPPEAAAAGIQGTVVLQVRIATDGHVKDLHVVSGPAILQKPALDAVRKWTYRPYLLNGSPVEVDTSVNVIFSLEN